MAPLIEDKCCMASDAGCVPVMWTKHPSVVCVCERFASIVGAI